MEQRIRDRYSDTILQAAKRRYGIAPSRIRPLDAFESFIYECERDSRPYILRIGHSLRRSEALIQGEVDWINTLAAGGVAVARAIPSDNGKLVEAIDDGQGGQFLAAAFVQAPGCPPREAGWTPELYETYGLLLGRMHALAERYSPAQPGWKRPACDDDSLKFVEHYLPAAETAVRARYLTLLDHLYTLPVTQDTYGLVHNDAHGSNLFIDDAGTITLFDFDDCAYNWFANDIAIVLFYIAMGEADAPGFTRQFMTHFLRGYRQAHGLDNGWLREIPHFLKLREIELFAVIHRDFDVNHIDDPWCARFMRDRKRMIENGAPYIDFDFESLAAAA